MKKCFIVLCTTLLIASGCSSTKEEPQKPSYTAGTYNACATGQKGDVCVDVTFDESTITHVEVTAHQETLAIGYGMNTTPIEVLPAKIVETQSLGLDTIAGATVTSNAIISAVSDAVTQANGNVEALKNVSVEKESLESSQFTTDIVVVGGGVAGLSAAVEAAQNGANVILVEKLGIAGGSTSRSGGKIIGAGTSLQAAQGIDDSAALLEEFYEDKGNGSIDIEKTTAYSNASAEQIEWLLANGWQAGDVEKTHSSYPINRVHNSLGGYWMISGNGGYFTVALVEAAQKAGVQILYNTPATELVVQEGKVTGIKAKHYDGNEITINADAVILATGGYTANSEMLLEQYGDFLGDYVVSSGGNGDTGDALEMVKAVNGDVQVADGALITYVSFTCGAGIYEEAGLIVSPTGKRLTNEYSYQYHLTAALESEHASYAYYITDADDQNQTIQYGMSMETTPHADSVEELAKLIGVDATTLQETIDTYNSYCDSGVDEEFGKPSEYLNKLEGTLYAIKYSPSIAATFGGINTNIKSEVLDTKGNVVPNLYAAGEVAFVGMTGLEYPSCGTAIGYGVYSGRTAAQEAIESQNK